MPDLTSKLIRLAKAEADGEDRVYVWRQILTEVWHEGFEAGYVARSSDQFVLSHTRPTEETGDLK